MSKPGWNWLANATKWHYFGEDGRSLCGRYLSLGSNDDASDDDRFSPNNCKECAKRRAKQIATGKENP